MENFSYHMPTRIVAGDACIRNNAELFEKIGKKALIVSGPNSVLKNKSLQDLKLVLQDRGIAYEYFNQIEENPSLSNIEVGASWGQGVDFVIGIGGGSSLDAAKAIAVLLKNQGQNPKILFEKKSWDHLPVVAVPTTAGSGSEVTPYAVLTLPEKKTKQSIKVPVFPTLAFIDLVYFKTMPIKVRQGTAIDALSHLVEGYLVSKSSQMSDLLAEAGLATWGQIKENLLMDEIKDNALEKLILSSTLGGMVIAQTGTSIPHGMGYDLTYQKKITHGMATGIFLVSFLRHHRNIVKVEAILALLGFKSLKKMDQFLGKMLPQDVAFGLQEIDGYVNNIWQNQEKLKSYPYELTKDDLKTIYQESLFYNKEKNKRIHWVR